MNELEELLANPHITDTIIEKTLREIELPLLAKALAGLDDIHRETFFHCASYSSRKQLAKLLKSQHNLKKKEIMQAQRVLSEKLNLNQMDKKDEIPANLHNLPPLEIHASNKHEIFASLLDISQRCQDYGLPSLESTMKNIQGSYLEKFIIKKGMEYVVSGRDLATTQALLKNLTKCMVQKIEEHLKMILKGMEHIHKGSSNKDLVNELKSYL